MERRAYALMVAVAVLMGALAVIAGQVLGISVRDPDGFLGPAWIRMPLLCVGAFLADLIPRTLWRARANPTQIRREATILIKEHWTKDRIVLVVLGLVCFYVTYVSYRNLKNYLPLLRPDQIPQNDYLLHDFDRWLLFGNDPATLLHNLLGTGVAAYVLSWDYLLFLPLVPVTVAAWLVWSRNISFGYWYVTAQGLCWTLGTASYYILPTLGPNFMFYWLYDSLPETGVAGLQDSLIYGRQNIAADPFTATGVQSVAGFASLHVAITLMMALVGQYTIRNVIIRTLLWVYVVVTLVSTTYFGWHYIADDIAGAFIAVVAFYLAALATGQKFDRGGRRSHPTTTTSGVPIDREQARPRAEDPVAAPVD